jgi:hypothetical protein
MVTVTRDSNVNMKILSYLKTEGFIEIFDVDIEDVPNKTLKTAPIAVLGYLKLDKSVLSDRNNEYDGIRKIIGKSNIGDAIKIEGHIRFGNDYFVTEDRDDILLHRKELEETFNIKILNIVELISKFMSLIWPYYIISTLKDN